MNTNNIRFAEDDIIIDRVNLAIIPVDSFTGQIINNLSIEIQGFNKKPVRNLSGAYVFVNLPPQANYRIVVFAETAGYFNPSIIDFSPEGTIGEGAADKLKKIILLQRKPEQAQKLEATLLSGIVVRENSGGTLTPLEQVTISVIFPDEGGNPNNPAFTTQSDQRGAFMLALRLPKPEIDGNVLVSVIFTLSSNSTNVSRTIRREIKEFLFYTFDRPIDIDDEDVSENSTNPTHPKLMEGAK